MRIAWLVGSIVASSVHAQIPIEPGGEPYVIEKVRVIDSRAVRGFVGAPVDGSLASGSWDGKVWEWPMRHAGAGVEYNYLNNNGLHLKLADDEGLNAVVVRGGIKAKLLRDVAKYDDPTSGQLVHAFPGGAKTSSAWFDAPIKTASLSFFDASDGVVADCSFFRVRRGLGDLNANMLPQLKQAIGQPIKLRELIPPGKAVTAVGVQFAATGAAMRSFTLSVVDPLNPRLLLHSADYAVSGDGDVNIVCDFPDQVVPDGTNLAVTIDFGSNVTLPKVGVQPFLISRDQALPEALEHRKFILHALYTPVSEARPWNVWNNVGDDEKYFAQPADTGDALQDRLRPFVRDIVTTLNQCRALDPDGKDEIVRQYHQWMFRKILTKSPGGMPEYPVKYAAIEGVPEWASLVHQAWMQAREVPKWWIENRMTPTGEFGGEIGDDTDMYQNYAAFPMLERDRVGGMVLDGGARLAELAEKVNLEFGVNKRSMDPLHAYEEGLNHEALMAYWNYGDPIYLERCMTAAKSTERMTMMTEKGHRHFRNNDIGSKDVREPGPPEREHGSHCLMWHPALITAWYNRNPTVMQWLSEWGDGWLAHMKPGEEANAVKLPEDVTQRSEALPFNGGWGMTGSVFTFLADLTGDARFVRPYIDYFARERLNAGVHFAELGQMGMLPADADIHDPPWNRVLYQTGDKAPFIAAIKKDIEELQRFPHMYTTVECFTDRVFLYAMINPAIAYTGGYSTRNKLNLNYAITYDGFGTDYAAFVTSATARHLKVLLCNISDKPISGKARLWRLEPGEYELTIGPDADNDDRADSAERTERLSITRGDEVALTLPPKVVQVVELKQLGKSEPIFRWPDLAIAARELELRDGKVSGVVHNIGGADAKQVVVALTGMDGHVIERKDVGPLAAPLDLVPKTLNFEFEDIPADAAGVVLDPDNAIPEIFEGNNRAAIDQPNVSRLP